MVNIQKSKKGFAIVRAAVAIFGGVMMLVVMVVLHPIIASLVETYIATSDNAIQNFAVRMIEIFLILVIFIGVLMTFVYGE